MRTVTIDQFMGFKPCCSYEYIKEIAGDKTEWTALDVLFLQDIQARYRLWAVLREEFIDAEVLHEFACQCAEKALALIENPDPRSVAAIAAKRAWLRGEIGNEQLTDARNAAKQAVGWSYPYGSVEFVALEAARKCAQCAAWPAAHGSAEVAKFAARRVFGKNNVFGSAGWLDGWDAAGYAAENAALLEQVSTLIEMLQELS